MWPDDETPEPAAWINFNAATGERNVSFECESELASIPLWPEPPRPQRQAPCTRHCEATAFQIEIRNLKARIAEGRRPLHDMAVFDLADEHLYEGDKNYGVLAFARAIERAHGIGGEE